MKHSFVAMLFRALRKGFQMDSGGQKTQNKFDLTLGASCATNLLRRQEVNGQKMFLQLLKLNFSVRFVMITRRV